MDYRDKINIYVPEQTGNKLDDDARLFEIFKRDSLEINRNKFLSMLIMGFYNQYSEENNSIKAKLRDEIAATGITIEFINQLTDNILKKIVLPQSPKRKGKRTSRLSLKPTIETENLILQISEEVAGEDYLSQYFCRMFMKYCTLPVSEREQIIFRNKFIMLKDACNRAQNITFTTIWEPRIIHNVIPYDITVGKEELFHYLLCEEFNSYTNNSEARVYRLNRIGKINYSNNTRIISDDVIKHLDMMKKNGPQYVINNEEETVVRLTKYGSRAYNRISYGRPAYKHIEKQGSDYLYYFECSEDQLFMYFRRFEGRDAVIISPKRLRNRMKEFHKDAYDNYCKE